MSQHFLVTLLLLVSLAAVGLFGLAMMLAWRDRRAARQHAIEHCRRMTAICRIQRKAERRIDGLVLATLSEMAATALRDNPMNASSPIPHVPFHPKRLP
ncbi:hypothetical protein PP348_20145 [Mycobacteroides abscessus]|uniref:hypothetical protein n=1 Tax=Mycobacteroides abscessus TaxID=36809 RepID=UPI0002EDC02F|nr:hypothetical protein [Mycobacteroides abscessus]MBN7379703.1 hypothetical protein [Mycobacteroides abscessus subsp. massiliense]MDM2096389.1 hypothetical protein [Mycobacteroides abscessus]MDM2121120.1 hypothetical protein [Mycobacteroides abscessus]MDM2124385.1 hypothetical protein [Mycobacteroides abscessus]MDM2130570.1 hypothetical protein [Mycobacteroides abscessus]